MRRPLRCGLPPTRTDRDVDVGAVLRQYRAEHRLKQSELADLLGITHQALSAIERGVTRLSPDRVVALRDTHRELWERLTDAMIADYAARLGRMDWHEDPPELPMSADEVDQALRLLERLRQQFGDV